METAGSGVDERDSFSKKTTKQKFQQSFPKKTCSTCPNVNSDIKKNSLERYSPFFPSFFWRLRTPPSSEGLVSCDSRFSRLRMGRPLKRHEDVSPRRASEKIGKVRIFASILLMNGGNHSFLCGNIARKMRVATWLKYEVAPTVFLCECIFHIQHSIISMHRISDIHPTWVSTCVSPRRWRSLRFPCGWGTIEQIPREGSQKLWEMYGK